MTIFAMENGWRDLSGEGPGLIVNMEKEGWSITQTAGKSPGRFYVSREDCDDDLEDINTNVEFAKLEEAVAYVEEQIAAENKHRTPKRFQHIRRMCDITRATPNALAAEYASLLVELRNGRFGEFSDLQTMIRYMKVVSALGMYQHNVSFPKALEDHGINMEDLI